MILQKLQMYLFVICYSITALASFCHSASNISIHKSYTVSPVQNYVLYAPAIDTTALTDGKYTFGFFWTQKTTLGWKNVKTVEILIDLGKEANIDSIVFSTARCAEAGINYPAQIAAFVGSSKDQFHYVGDIAKNPGNVSGAYQTKKFVLNGVAASGRYVLLEVRPSGPFLFCDEIEVLEGISSAATTETLSREKVRFVAENSSKLGVERRFLTGIIDEVISKKTVGIDSAQLPADIQLTVDNLAVITDAEAIESDILRLRATQLRTQFPGKSILIESVNPWAPLSPTVSPVDTPQQNISMTIPRGGYDHAAFVVTNLTANSREIFLQPGVLPQEAPILAFYQVPFVKSAAMEYIADPLMPINGSFILRSGESKMVFLAAHGEQPGNWLNTLKITAGEEAYSVPLTLQVSTIALPAILSLNSVNWGYLDFKPIRDQKPAAVKDLYAHHTNTIVIPPAYIPFAYPTKPHDVVRLDKYLQLHKGASKVLFFTNFNNDSLLTSNGKYPFMSAEWKNVFRKFYGGLVKSAETAGFSEDQLYMYPFDEMKEKEIGRYIALASWAHKEIPAIKFYASLDNTKSLKTLPYLDIAQVINHAEMFADAEASKKEIWLYSAGGNTKSLSPYSYYRLMSWQAFYLGFKGVGFWNYADTGSGENPGSAWDDFDGNRPDFSVIYEGAQDTIISSRRWEAWRMGIEDYELLTMYAKTKGDKTAKDLVQIVLKNPLDVGKADEVRRQVLRELSGSPGAPLLRVNR